MTIFTDKVTKYNSRLMTDLQIDNVQAAGIWGNIGGETGGFKALQEIKPTVAGSRGGYGWLQWTGPRRKKYEAWCAQRNVKPSDDEANYGYLVYETRTDEAHSLAQLKKTSTVEAATETFMKQNLRPGAPHLEGRITWAKMAFEATKNQAKSNNTVIAGTVLAGAGTATAASQIQPHHLSWLHDHWVLTGVCIAVIAGLIIHGIHKLHDSVKLPEAPVVTKKAKKNG